MIYAKWREDKPADANYSRELVDLNLDPKYYDNMHAIPPYKEGMFTYLDYFEDHVKKRPNEEFLGYRPIDSNGKHENKYVWMTY